MKVEIMVYIYIAICISMIIYNCVYIFVLRHKEAQLSKNSTDFSAYIKSQIDNLNKGKNIDDSHKKMILKKLKRTDMLLGFDKSVEIIAKENKEDSKKYLKAIAPELNTLVKDYKEKDIIVSAYFSYILGKYSVLDSANDNEPLDIILGFLHSDNVYCRENALSAIYSTGDVGLATEAIKIIDKNKAFHHPKLVCDGLVGFSGDKTALFFELFKRFDYFSLDMQINILNFGRFANIRSDDEMLLLLNNEKAHHELRFCAIRYFEKFPNEKAKNTIKDFARGIKGLPWQYQSIASQALASYSDDEVVEILKKNLSNSNWYIRLNSAISCEKLDYTYTELIDVFDGNDRYAREIIRYRLDRRAAEEMAVKKQ